VDAVREFVRRGPPPSLTFFVRRFFCAMSSFANQMQPEASERRGREPSAYLRRALTAALVLCPVFLAIMGAYWVQGLHEDFPEESFWDPLAGFFLGFPFLFATGVAAPFGIPQAAYVFVGVTMDGLFWAFAGVSIHSTLRWLLRRKRLSDEARTA
jgi:hypothetical protein